MPAIHTTSLLGRVVTDRITGFSGTVTGVAIYLTGCNQVLVVPKTAEDGALRDSQWFDQQRLTIDDPSAAPVVLDNAATPGPDKEAPKR